MEYQNKITSLKQQKQREKERHQNVISQLEKQKQAENDRYNKYINNINKQIEITKNAQLAQSNETFNYYSKILFLLDEILKD